MDLEHPLGGALVRALAERLLVGSLLLVFGHDE